MATIYHIFESHKRIQGGVVVSHDHVERRATLEYDATGNHVTISILPTLSAKRANLVRQDLFTLYYQGEDPAFKFELECWPDNGTIKRLSVIRVDMNLEVQYLSSHQDAM